jgi:hypothetical protein
MITTTYNEQFNKITEAYIKGDIKPFDPNFCFCGTLCDNEKKWTCRPYGGYNNNDFFNMESALYKELIPAGLKVLDFRISNTNVIENWQNIQKSPNYETALFNGMVAALEVLKQIHIEHGEVIDNVPVFVKRKALNAI